MKHFINTIVVCLFTVACGGSVERSDLRSYVDPGETEYSSDDPVVATPSGSAGTAGTSSTGGSGNLAGSGGTTSEGGEGGSDAEGGEGGDSGLGGAGGADDGLKKLIIELNDPFAGVIYAGGKDQVLFAVSFSAPVSDIWVDDIPFTLFCSDELAYRGSNGTDYLTDIKIKDSNTGAILMGPTELAYSQAEPNNRRIHLFDAFEIKKGETRNLWFTVDVAGTEDMAGELIGKTCRITLADWATIQAQDSPREHVYLTPDEIDPSTEIVGNSKKIIKNPGCVGCPGGPQPDPCTGVPHSVFGYVDGQIRRYYVRDWLEFGLNPASPSGTVGDGLQEVIRVDATAHCGDIVLEHVLFQTTTNDDDIGWMLAVHQNEVLSGISYEFEGIPTFHGYGAEHVSKTESSVTGLYWNHEFTAPILIKEGETFTFSLSVTFGGPVIPPGTFNFRLYPRYTWYAPDNREAYPEVMEYGGDGKAEGHVLSYVP